MISSDKTRLRADMRALRKQLARENPQAAQQVLLHLPELLETLFETEQSFAEERKTRQFVAAVYKAQGSELSAAPLAAHLQAQGVDLALPVATAADAPLEFRRWTRGDPLEIDVSGVPASLSLAEVVQPDVIFIPLLAFDRRGYRLGQGGGYYDRTLNRLRAAKRPTWDLPHFIGLCYAGQEVEKIDNEPHDERLHGVLTERFASTVWKK